MPEEKELDSISSRASDAFYACCRTFPNQNLNRVFRSKAHNIFISFGNPDAPIADSSSGTISGIMLLEERKTQENKMREYLYKTGEDWIYRIQLPQNKQEDCLILDFVGRDSLLMKNIFTTPRFAQLRTQCKPQISSPSKK
jgi:hypothetical protein